MARVGEPPALLLSRGVSLVLLLSQNGEDQCLPADLQRPGREHSGSSCSSWMQGCLSARWMEWQVISETASFLVSPTSNSKSTALPTTCCRLDFQDSTCLAYLLSRENKFLFPAAAKFFTNSVIGILLSHLQFTMLVPIFWAFTIFYFLSPCLLRSGLPPFSGLQVSCSSLTLLSLTFLQERKKES